MSSSSNFMNKVEEDEDVRKRNEKPQWIERFLQLTFFDCCLEHPIWRNEKNKYCIDCSSAVCQYCWASPTHRHHKVVKIYRHVYKDVVSLDSIEEYLDCAQIQPFKCNKRLILALSPLPHCGPTMNPRTACEICQRRLAEPNLYRYCSISCKVMAFDRKSSELAPPYLTIPKKEKPKNKRKGIPQRAPFF